MSRAPEPLRLAVIDAICDIAPIAFQESTWVEPRAGYADAADETLARRLDALLDELTAEDYELHRDRIKKADAALAELAKIIYHTIP